MLRRVCVRCCSSYTVPPHSRVAIFALHLDPPTLQHRELLRLLLGQYDTDSGGSSGSHGSVHKAATAATATTAATRVRSRLWYMQPFADSLASDSQLAPFDDVILVPNTRYPVNLRRSAHLAALAVLGVRGLAHVHVDFTALEHPDETMPIVAELTRRYARSVLVHWLHDAYEMRHWRHFADMRRNVPVMLLQTHSLAPALLTRRSAPPSLTPQLHTRQYAGATTTVDDDGYDGDNNTTNTMSSREQAYFVKVQQRLRDAASQRWQHTLTASDRPAFAATTTRVAHDEAADGGSRRSSDNNTAATAAHAVATPAAVSVAHDDDDDAYVRGAWWRIRGGRGDDVVEVNKLYTMSEVSAWLGTSLYRDGSTSLGSSGSSTSLGYSSSSSFDDDDDSSTSVATAVDMTTTTNSGSSSGAGAFAMSTVRPLRTVRQLIDELFPLSPSPPSQRRRTRSHKTNNNNNNNNKSNDNSNNNDNDDDDDDVPMLEVHPVTRCTGADVRQALWEQQVDLHRLVTPAVQRYMESHLLYSDARKGTASSSAAAAAAAYRGSRSGGLGGGGGGGGGLGGGGGGMSAAAAVAGPLSSSLLFADMDARSMLSLPLSSSSSPSSSSLSSSSSYHYYNNAYNDNVYGGVAHDGLPPRTLLPRDTTTTTTLSLPGLIPRLELHYDRANLLAREQYELLKAFECNDGDEPDLIVPIGGDGYMMHCIRKNWRRFLPFYGINAGHVGYLLNDRSCIDELFAAPLKLHKTTMLYCEAERDEGGSDSDSSSSSSSGDGDDNGRRRRRGGGGRVLLSELAFNDAWVERASGQTALIRILVNGEERIRRLRGDGVLVSTAAGSTAYSRALGASPLPVGAPLLQVVGSNVVSPAQWQPVHLDQEDAVELEVLDTAKRPCRCFVDSVDMGTVTRMLIRASRVASVSLCFSQSFDLQQKLYQLQFPQTSS